jgi:hypothetical protein
MVSIFRGKRTIGVAGAGFGCLGCLLPVGLVLALVVLVIAAAGNFLGWIFAGGPPDEALAVGIEYRSPSTTIHLWTPTPIPPACFEEHLPQSTVVVPTPSVPDETPVPITVWIPTPTPCPPPPNVFPTPDPRWSPAPAGYGPRGSPYRDTPYWITQPYGCTSFPEFQDRECSQSSGGRKPWFHRGFDMVSKGDKTVYATLEGTVQFSGYSNGGFGIFVSIRNGEFLVIYPHLSRALVRAGEQVAWGQPIGVEGSTGYSTGSHLHYQIEINGHWVDPVPYLPPCPGCGYAS